MPVRGAGPPRSEIIEHVQLLLPIELLKLYKAAHEAIQVNHHTHPSLIIHKRLLSNLYNGSYSCLVHHRCLIWLRP